MHRPLVLLSNDDGYDSPGLEALRNRLASGADVVVCAPHGEQSAASHSLTLNRPLILRRHAPTVFSVDGTPADSVYVALYAEGRILPRTPDVVVSGINIGLNLGMDVHYSGTVAAAREAALRGIPAIAASAGRGADLDAAAQFLETLVRGLLDSSTTVPLLLNVNFPPGSAWLNRITTLGRREYAEGVEFRADPRGREYLWLGRPGVRHPPAPGSDTEAYDEGVVGITPLRLDPTTTESSTGLEQLNAYVSLHQRHRAPGV